MKKVLFLILAVTIAFAANAQKHQPSPLLKERAKTILDIGVSSNHGPLKPATLTDSKAIDRIPFGSSLNMLTLTATEANTCVYNKDLDYLMFTHRAGGAYGGSSGDIRCHFTPYVGATAIDSVEFIHQGTNLMRYPGGVIYNPAGNTDPANAYAIITGPCTNGSGWVNNYFCSQKLDGSSIKFHFEALNDTFRPPYVNLTACDGGKIKAAGLNATVGGLFYFKNGQIQGDSVAWSTDYMFINSYQTRHFSNDTTPWAFSPYMAFSKDGMTGYFYVMALEATDDMLANGPRPVVWKTIDGGLTWNKMAIPNLSTMSAKMKSVLKPIRSTLELDSSLFVYRPGIMSGATVEETNFPGVVDMNGNLHIAVNVEGMYSNHPDSLFYTYAYNMWNMFDLHTTSTGWDIELVDTIHAGIDKGVVLSDQYLDHSFHVARNEAADKIFFMWTDTDLDTANYMPDIHARMFDVTAGTFHASNKLTSQSDYYLFNAAHDVVDNNNGTYYLPATFAVINGSDTDAEPTHHFIKGMIYPIPTGINENENAVTINNVSVNPNPAIDYVNVDFKIDRPANVKVSVYNLLGKEVLSKNYGKQAAGASRVKLNTSDFSSGIYFFTVQAGNERITKKVVIE
ncbi:MAG TPA: T9SS type A sorting domain-containing protein [Bacteroidales bacterium]|nr:T9SS type A sorting domain-containing protein [Bacteroidales bacterium]